MREEEEAFREAAAAGHTLLPLQRCIFSDHLTPVLAYRCLVREDDREAPSFLFESVEQGLEGTTNVVRPSSLIYSLIDSYPCNNFVELEWIQGSLQHGGSPPGDGGRGQGRGAPMVSPTVPPPP